MLSAGLQPSVPISTSTARSASGSNRPRPLSAHTANNSVRRRWPGLLANPQDQDPSGNRRCRCRHPAHVPNLPSHPDREADWTIIPLKRYERRRYFRRSSRPPPACRSARRRHSVSALPCAPSSRRAATAPVFSRGASTVWSTGSPVRSNRLPNFSTALHTHSAPSIHAPRRARKPGSIRCARQCPELFLLPAVLQDQVSPETPPVTKTEA